MEVRREHCHRRGPFSKQFQNRLSTTWRAKGFARTLCASLSRGALKVHTSVSIVVGSSCFQWLVWLVCVVCCVRVACLRVVWHVFRALQFCFSTWSWYSSVGEPCGCRIATVLSCSESSHRMRILHRGARRWDSVAAVDASSSTSSRPLLRVSVTSDEGPTGLGLLSMLNSEHVSMSVFRDPCHRLSNSASLGLMMHPLMRRAASTARQLFKLTRGPWKGCRFGRMIKASGGVPTYQGGCSLRGMCV